MKGRLVMAWNSFSIDSVRNPWDFAFTGSTRADWSFIQPSGKWLYCNFPEQIPEGALGDFDSSKGGQYLNWGYVNGSTGLYASHKNVAGELDFYFGIQLYNPGPNVVTVTPGNFAFRSDYSSQSVFNVWRDFYASQPSASFQMQPHESRWIMVDKLVRNQEVFNAVQRFSTNGQLAVFVYVYTSRSKLDGYASLYPFDSPDVIRGMGNCNLLQTATAGREFIVTGSGNKWHWFSNGCPNGTMAQNTNEIVSITEPGTNQVFSCSNWSGKIANFGLQYVYNIKLVNRSAGTRTVKFYVGAGNYIHTNNFLRYGSNMDGGTLRGWNHDLTGNPTNKSRGNERWLFLTDTIGAGATKQFSFEHIMCGNSNSPVLFQIETA